MTPLWLALILGCAVPAPEPAAPAAAVFPHPDGYPAHGVQWRQDSATCLRCHAPGAADTSAGPPCGSCHPTYPHLPSLRDGAVHGLAFASAGEGCALCHGPTGERRAAGVAGSACADCHASYPHGEGFRGVHGAAVRQRGGPQACAACHPGQRAPSCQGCHDTYPHPAGWAAPEHHGAADGSCGGCHGPPAPPGTPTCATCHDTYPHPADWVAFGHLGAVQARGDAGCLGCHPSMPGPRLRQGCAPACHGGAP